MFEDCNEPAVIWLPAEASRRLRPDALNCCCVAWVLPPLFVPVEVPVSVLDVVVVAPVGPMVEDVVALPVGPVFVVVEICCCAAAGAAKPKPTKAAKIARRMNRMAKAPV